MSNRVYGFYGFVPELKLIDEWKLMLGWRERWSAAGFDPFVLTEWHCQQHPYWPEYFAAVGKLPSVNPPPYETLCYLRWLALAQAGGGFLSDFDVAPYAGAREVLFSALDYAGFKEDAHTFQGAIPSVAYASAGAAEKLSREFALGKWGRQEINGREHFSDMYALEAMAGSGEVEWLKTHNLVKNFGEVGWESAPLVHFSSGSMKPTYEPKWKHIPKLRT